MVANMVHYNQQNVQCRDMIKIVRAVTMGYGWRGEGVLDDWLQLRCGISCGVTMFVDVPA